MSLIRMQNNVPEVYVNQSRDFQLLCRMFDVIFNGIKFDVDTTSRLTDTKHIQSSLLKLLQTKLGFFEENNLDDELRIVLDAFPYIIKNKGSLKAIEQTLNVYLRLNHVDTPVKINIVGNGDNRLVQIMVKSKTLFNTKIVDDILKYVLPTGYEVSYVFYQDVSVGDTEVAQSDAVRKYRLTPDNSVVRKNTIAGLGDDFANGIDNVEIAGSGNIDINWEEHNYPSTDEEVDEDWDSQ